MNKSDLIRNVAKQTGATQKDTEALVNAIFEVIKDALVDGEKVTLPSFGTFEARDRAERNGVNPQNGTPLVIPACKKPCFKASKTLKDALNQ